MGERNLLLRNLSDSNAEEGFRSQGNKNSFITNTAIGNGDEGFRLRDPEAQGNLLVGNVAHFGWHKAQEVLVRAARILGRSHPDAVVLLVA